ncbi:dephospho-CoA kinase [Aestuariivirga sp.]|uniref:dephospho-CoA kinase n=1 Tax=Aestuariivirga sp. TaxID=2650926 RepID=UPI00359307F3
MIVVGLTGSIAMGKTETAKMFANLDIPVFDSDGAVHELYGKGGEAAKEIGRLEPSAIIDEAVDRKRLAAKVLERPGLLHEIEKAVHPLIRVRQERFLSDMAQRGADIAILDIPLLFETGRDKEVDRIIVVSAPPDLQRERALKRPHMTVEKLDYILSKQLPDVEKRSRADYVIDTSVSLDDARRQVEAIIEDLRKNQSGHGQRNHS